MGNRVIQDTFETFMEKYDLPRKIEPHDLKIFGMNHDRSELIEWLNIG